MKRTPATHRTHLSNGLRVVLCPTPHLTEAHVGVFFEVGSRYEASEENGLTHVLEHMLFRGTKRYRTSNDLNAAAENIGGVLNAATYRDHVVFSLGCHADELREAISILSDMLQAPRYRALEVERAIIQEELLESLDEKGRCIDADSLLHRLIFGGQGLGQPIEGTMENLRAFSKRDIEVFRQLHLVAENAVVVVAGRMNPKTTLKWLETSFGMMAKGAGETAAVPLDIFKGPCFQYVDNPGSQVELCLAFRGMAPTDPLYPSIAMLCRLLTDGMSSRVHRDLVDGQGVAYSLSAGLTTYIDCSLFDFAFAVAPERVVEAGQAVIDFVARARRFRYSNEELERCRRRYHYDMDFMWDSTEQLVDWHGRQLLFGFDRYEKALTNAFDKMRPRQLSLAAKHLFQAESMALVAVGELKSADWQTLCRRMASDA